jgi:pimeloyl-ACP methyl ester carboxylesterase
MISAQHGDYLERSSILFRIIPMIVPATSLPGRRVICLMTLLASTGSANLLHSQPTSLWHDASPHTVQFVTVDENVRLEVLDWGGSGRSIVLLAGGGNTAHVFDDFAPKLAHDYHVYGITRRGFGASSVPASGYEADRLGDDVLAVLDSLKLARPVLIGHSLGGEELSSVGSRYRERVAGLAYLEAGYQYAFDNGRGGTLDELQKSANPKPPPPQPSESDMASFGSLQAWFIRINGVTQPEAEFRQGWDSTPDGRVGKRRSSPMLSIMKGMRKYTDIPVPALVIFAVPHDQGPWIKTHPDRAVREAATARSAEEAVLLEKQVKAFEDGVPGARVVRLPGAHHYVFLSNEADVLREIRAFVSRLE